MMNWHLLLIPVAIWEELLAPERYLLVLITSALAILPLAGWMAGPRSSLRSAWVKGLADC